MARNKARAQRRNEARREARQLAALTPARKGAKAEPVEKLSDRDGLEWLISKDRLKGSRIRAGRYYRRLYRDAPVDDGASIKSNLDRSVGGGKGEPPALVRADAAIKLRFVRAALSHHPQMIELLDAVCGGGRTVLEMANGDDRKSLGLEAVLGIALDLVSLAQAQQEAAERIPQRESARPA